MSDPIMSKAYERCARIFLRLTSEQRRKLLDALTTMVRAIDGGE